jgi:hypothetical protein
MKKVILMLLMVLGIGIYEAKAQIYAYQTTEFAYKQVNSYGNWTNWSSWEPSNILLTINFDNDIVTIYSNTTQVYHIIQYVRNYVDDSGGKQAEFRFIDQDGDRGTMRLRIERSGNSQVYIEFSNIMWVYNVKRISQWD